MTAPVLTFQAPGTVTGHAVYIDGQPSRLIIGATEDDAAAILARAVTLGIVPLDADATIRPVTGPNIRPVRMSTTEQRRRVTGRQRTAA